MIIELIRVKAKRYTKSGFKESLKLRCDQCHGVFIRNNVKTDTKRKFHFCKRGCSDSAQRPNGVLFKHPPNVISINEMKQFLYEKFGDLVIIDETTYVNTGAKARFIDRDYGEWWAKPNNIRNANDKNGCHPARGFKNRQTTWLEIYGVDNPFKSDVVQDKASKSNWKSTQITHWRTNKQLTCTAGYEVAFVNWCNHNQIDFDWQIWYKLSNGQKYKIDAFILDGQYKNTWIEIKGWFRDENSKLKWELFHQTYPNSQLWNKNRLQEIGIL